MTSPVNQKPSLCLPIQCEQKKKEGKSHEVATQRLVEMNQQLMESVNLLTKEVKMLKLNDQKKQNLEKREELVNRIVDYFMHNCWLKSHAHDFSYDGGKRDKRTRQKFESAIKYLCQKHFFSKLDKEKTPAQVYAEFLAAGPVFKVVFMDRKRPSLGIDINIGIKEEFCSVSISHLFKIIEIKKPFSYLE